MSINNEKLRIRVKRVMVAIMSVLLVLSLVTTISFDVAALPAYAAGEEAAAPAEQAPAEAAPAEGQAAAAPAEGEAAAAPAAGEAAAPAAGEAAAAPAEGAATPAEGAATAPAEGEAAAGTEGDQAAAETEEEPVSSDPLDTGLRRQTEAPDISATSAIVMSGSTSEVVYEKHAERKMSPGKITMLMNAMVVIDNMYNDAELSNTVDITEDLMQYGDTFQVGESVSVGDLLQAMLVGGSDQAAEALATYSASSRKIFIKEMNSKARERGLMDTQFSNPKGSYNAKTYSTARDCAVIVQAAMRYQLIKDYFAKRTIRVKAVSQAGEREIPMRNTNPLLTGTKQSELYSLTKGGILGKVGDPVKGVQYAGAATVDDMQLIVVLMDSKASKAAYEAKALFQYGDTKVTRNTIVKAGKKVGKARVRGGNITHVNAYTETKGFAYVPPEGSNDLVQTEVVMYDDLEAPLKEGSKVGEFRIYVADELKGTVDLVTKTEVTRGWWPSRYYISNFTTVIIGIVLFLILLLILRIIYVRKRRDKIRAIKRERRLREMARQQLAMEEDRRRRNWTDRTGISDQQLGPRTGDLREMARRETRREELIAEAARTGASPKTIVKKKAKTEKKREAAREKAKKKNTSTDVRN